MEHKETESRIREGANVVAETIRGRDDFTAKSILLYLARADISPIYQLESLLKGYLSTDQEIFIKINDLASAGMLEIYHGREVTNGTTIIRLTHFGKEVSMILENDEMTRGYPTIKQLILSIIYNRVHEKYPSSNMNKEAISSYLSSDMKLRLEEEIRDKIMSDHIISELSSLYMSIS